MANELYLPSGGIINFDQPTQNPYLAVESSDITRINGVSDDDLPIVMQLLKVWKHTYPRNLIRSAYYDAKEKYKDFGISIPNTVKTKAAVPIGWPEKAVRSLADKSQFEGFEIPDGTNTYGIDEIADMNALDVDFSQATTSAYKHSCSFLTVSEDPDDDTNILIMPRSADWSAALWDNQRRDLLAALTITDNDSSGQITAFTVWMRGYCYSCTKSVGWNAQLLPSKWPKVAAEPLTFDAQMDRPFGHSRINRVVMNLTDIGYRTIMRMEASAEFYSVPKLWFLGADKEALSADTWSSLISAINAINSDIDGNTPQIKQIEQASMTPHGQMLETIAMLVSSQTDIPPEELGIRVTNPTSAEALAAAENRLTRTANRQNKHFARQLRKVILMATVMKNPDVDMNTIQHDLRAVRPIFSPTKESSDASKADYYSKLAAANPAFADSDVGLRKAGLTFEEIQSFRTYQQHQRVIERTDQLRNSVLNPVSEASHGSQQSQASSRQASGTATTPQQST